MFKNKKLRRGLITVIIISSILVLITPWLIRGDSFGLKEELWETVIIFFFLALIYASAFLYFKEYKRLRARQGSLEDRLQEIFKYIGSINLQIDEIKNIFSALKRYPENKKDIKAVFDYFSEKVLGLVNSEWVVLRIINTKNNRTLRESRVFRGNQEPRIPRIDNQGILSTEKQPRDYFVILSEQDNLSIKACCVLPVKISNREQKFFIQSIVSQLEMMFLVFSSLHQDKGKIISRK